MIDVGFQAMKRAYPVVTLIKRDRQDTRIPHQQLHVAGSPNLRKPMRWKTELFFRHLKQPLRPSVLTYIKEYG